MIKYKNKVKYILHTGLNCSISDLIICWIIFFYE